MRAAEADERMRDKYGARHDIVSSSWTSGKKGMSVGDGLDGAPVKTTRPACCEMAPQAETIRARAH